MAGTRYHLELPRASQVPVVGRFPDGHVLRREVLPEASLSRMLYEDVGRAHAWVDRLGWSDEAWTYHFMKPQVQLWVLWAVSDPAGYFELRRDDDGESVEIAYFGLRPPYVGRGLGGRLLACAVREARQVGSLVRTHTCTSDHPHALPNYQARGFEIVREEAL